MRLVLNEAFRFLATLNVKHLHYKLCSTFDSSKDIGNLGVVIECGKQHFNTTLVPIVVPAPHLGRYVSFGNLFARMGIGTEGAIYRIDQHPSMREHPATPATVGDLRDHLKLQTDLKMGLIDVLDLETSQAQIDAKISQLEADKMEVLFFDGINDDHMKTIGTALEQRAQHQSPLFSLGSSGVQKALGDYWNATNVFSPTKTYKKIASASKILVLSGSMSPVTERQIEHAIKNGFKEIKINPTLLFEPNHIAEEAVEKLAMEALNFFQKGFSVLVHTTKGKEDPRVALLKNLIAESQWDEATIKNELPKRFGCLLGRLANAILVQTSLERVVIAGGDTSSYVARTLGIKAVEMIAPFVNGAPICRAMAPNYPIHQKQLNIKGGQVGAATYFVDLLKIENTQ